MTDTCHYSDTCCSDDENKEFDSDEDEYYIRQMEYSEQENHKDFIISDSSDDESDISDSYEQSVYSSVYSGIYNE